jgi:hypothetical protein
MADLSPGVFPRFYMRAVQSNFETERQGRPIFNDEEYVEIIMAGGRPSGARRGQGSLVARV